MAVLANPQWEMFCRECLELVLAGEKDARQKAYIRAGYADKNATDNARRLANRPEVKARFKQLFAEALEYRDVRLVTVVTRIDRVARANVADFYADDGKTLKNIKDLPRELTDALKSVKVKDDGDGGKTVEIELWDKNQANFTLLKHQGGLPDDDRPRAMVNIFAGLSVDDQRALAEALEALPAGPPSLDSEVAGERGGA